MGVAVSSSHLVSAAPSSSGGGLLTLCPCSSVRSLPRETVLHELPQRGSFPRAAVLQEQAAPVWVPPRQGHKPCQQTCSGMGTSLHGSISPGRSLLQRGLPTESQPPSGIHLLWHGVPSTGCRWRSAPPWTSMGCRGTACLTMVFSTGCRGISAPAPGAPPPPPSSLALVSAELFLSHRLTPLSSLLFYHSFFSSPS